MEKTRQGCQQRVMRESMRQYRYTLNGEQCTVHFPERGADLDGFERFAAQGHVLAYDHEGSGLQIFAPGHKLRLVQFGNRTDAWVLRADKFRDQIIWLLRQDRWFVCHNAVIDCMAADRHLDIPLETLLPRCWDTRIMAHLIDPRSRKEGGIGLRLKELTSVYVDPAAPDTEEELTAVFNSMRLTKANGYARINVEHPTYLLYAGLDVLLTRRLLDKLVPLIKGQAQLCQYEHHVQLLLAYLQRQGQAIDVPYAQRLQANLLNEAYKYAKVARSLGVQAVDSPPQVAAALIRMGEHLTETTETGQPKVDRAILAHLADLDRNWVRIGAREPNPLADAVMRSKRAGKWGETYANAFLERRDAQDRIHPSINALQARTARMSVAQPPLHQLPTGDWRIRRGIVADPGHSIIAVDYKTVEMRVLAALARDEVMLAAIRAGVDIHGFTAEQVFGTGYTARQRQFAKVIGFAKVYGGGALTISRQTGTPIDNVKLALEAYNTTFKGIRRYSYQLMNEAQAGHCEVVTPWGRRLPLDPDRLYTATNYIVQSTSRDLLAAAIVRLFTAGLGQYLLLPVHDEIIAQAPVDRAQEIVDEIGRIMATEFQGVPIETSAKVYGPSWGHGYGENPELEPEELIVSQPALW